MNTVPRAVAAMIRRELLELARIEDDRAADAAAAVPYWSHRPASIAGHEAAAGALRAAADRFLDLTAH
ncbi:hypothetical protein ACIBL3_41160 [Kribbella sp. NPDC050124]|uniref:hypothetical protein n=1 Tax=Kribbella sp. NPDC050124 TaxID=3364114 RepID=UPI0037905D2F